jgi:hypothetical protein
MFSVVNSFSELPSVVNNGDKFFCSLENNVFVYFNDSWVDYETFVDGFEEIVNVTLDSNFSIVDEQVLFIDSAPFYDNFKLDYIYPIIFTANSLEAFDSDVFNFSIIKQDSSPLVSCSTNKIEFPEFKSYFWIDEDKNNLEEVSVKDYSNAFNVLVSNINIVGPVSLKLFKPVGV